jgi:S-adenosylmethionine decarboxylase
MSISQPRFAFVGTADEVGDQVAGTCHPNLTGTPDQPLDHFKEVDGVRFAGSHLILDMWEANNLDDEEALRRAMIEATSAANATLLHVHLHRFSPYGGISGVAVLAESHISVHTWPERGFAAFDIFMCGDADPQCAADVLTAAMRPGRAELREFRRGEEGDAR